MTDNRAIKRIGRLPWSGVLVGIAYGIVLRLLATAPMLRDLDIPRIVSLSFILVVPAVMGAITVWFGSPAQRARYLFRIFAPWLTILGAYAAFLAASLETLVCLVMIFPTFAISASLGGILAGWGLTFAASRRKTTLMCFALLPLVFSPIEELLPVQTEYRTVDTTLIVHAPRAVVWQHLTSVPAIRADELQWSFSHAIGIPKPVEARLNRPGVGATRDIYWERDVHFKEHIVEWQEGEGFAYRVDVTQAARALRVVDMHVVIGDQYFDVTEGRYALRSLENGDTLVTLSTTYRMSTRINFYGRLWADFVLNDFHRVVLKVIANRAEHDVRS